MAHWIRVAFYERNVSRVPRGVQSTTPNVRAHVTGGETFTPAPIVTDIVVDAICTTAQLGILRDLLAYGDTGALDLANERIEFCQLIEISPPVNIYDTDTWECSLTFEQVGEVINPVMKVRVGNTTIMDVLSFSTSVGRLTRFAKATINCASPHGQRGDLIEISGNVNFGVDLLFRGILERVSSDYYPGTWTLECVGKFKSVQRQWWQVEEYTGQTDGAMITNLVEKRGLPAHSIQSSGWVLGQRADVLLREGDTFSSWIDQLDEIARYVTFERDDGVIERRRHDPFEVGAARWTVEEGVDILSIRRSEDLDGIRNRIQVTGISKDGVQVTADVRDVSPELDAIMPATAPNYNAETIRSDLIETFAHCTDIATRHLADLKRAWQSLEITIPFFPAMNVGYTVNVRAPSLGIMNKLVMIWDVKHEFDGEGGTTTITTNTGQLGSIF